MSAQPHPPVRPHTAPTRDADNANANADANADANTDANTGPLVDVTHDAYGMQGVVRLTLNRPAAFNALSEAMLDELQTQLSALETSDARVVVLAGAGRAFCAGHDLKEMRAAPSLAYYEALFARCTKMMLTIRRLPQPVIARVHGVATAAGCQLVAMCDLAVAADTARFATSGVNLGLFCATPSVALSRNVLPKAALEMLLTGEFIDALVARQHGLINRVVPLDALDADIATLAASICAKPRDAVRAGKALFYGQLETGVEAAYQLAGQTMACNMMMDSALEGVQAFVDKRPPAWCQ
ncbi:Enoyl-CoA-hydratase [Paraburkholderia solisilvae]|uniref:Enoyl-CoA hydratase domain-containing protein 3, mitochondrial n=2 Tax=Paraburkholderia solisilvae TaxID=624376 RepID=A0A6J5EBX2_9BURK|nr:Enoyl-CoA-hydratase [Paraburkholderia solisilvae]